MGLGLKSWATRLDGAVTDLRLGIATGAPRPASDTSWRNAPYEPLPYEALRPMSEAADCRPTDRVVDLGCGKGRLVCWFARQAVALCRGVDIDPDLIEAARRNAQRLRGARATIQFECADATQVNLDEATVVTLYNPFGAEVMAAVAQNLAQSLARRPRPLRIVYANPVHLPALLEGGFEVRERRLAPYFGGRIELVVVTARDAQLLRPTHH